MKKVVTVQHPYGRRRSFILQLRNVTMRGLYRSALGILLTVAFASPARAASDSEFPKAFKKDPLCWHYVNALGEEFLLKLHALGLGGTSFIVSGSLAGDEGQSPIFGNAELLNGRVKSNLTLNDAFPTIPTSTFLSAVQFTVDLDLQTLNGDFEWLAPTLSGPDPNGPREFNAFSLRGTLTFLSNGNECKQQSELSRIP
jgi:hypothetical protein